MLHKNKVTFVDKPMPVKTLFLLTCLAFITGPLPGLQAQQVPDTSYAPGILHPTHDSGSGPLVLIDRAHHNFHTREGGFAGFARLLTLDGYRTGDLSGFLEDIAALDGCRILVIANALDASNVSEWALPTPPAFTAREIETILKWVSGGGRLLLIADHMPFAGAADALGAAFGFRFLNGFAFTAERAWPPSVFTLSDGTLCASPVTAGRYPEERIDRVVTFTGSAFSIPREAIPVLQFEKEHWSLQPDTAWRFGERTPRVSLDGYYQGALLVFGRGRIAVFGEAAMFTAQVANGSFKVGFNSEEAPQNATFVLNVMRWLDGKD